MIKKILVMSLVFGALIGGCFQELVAMPARRGSGKPVVPPIAEEVVKEEIIKPSVPLSEIVVSDHAISKDTAISKEDTTPVVADTLADTTVVGGEAPAPQPTRWQRAKAYVGSKASSAWQKVPSLPRIKGKVQAPAAEAPSIEPVSAEWNAFLNSEIPYDTAFGKKLGRKGYLGFGKRQTGTTYRKFAEGLGDYLAKFDEKAERRLGAEDMRVVAQWKLNEDTKRLNAEIEGTEYTASAQPVSELQDRLKVLQDLKALFEQQNAGAISDVMNEKFMKSMIEEDSGYKLNWNWWLSKLYEVGTKKKAPARRTYSSSSSDDYSSTSDGDGSGYGLFNRPPSRDDVERSEQWRSAAPGEAYEAPTSTPDSSSTWSDYASDASLF